MGSYTTAGSVLAYQGAYQGDQYVLADFYHLRAVEFMASVRAQHARYLASLVAKETKGGEIPHVEGDGWLFVPASPNGDGTICMKVFCADAERFTIGGRRHNLPLSGNIDTEVGEAWSNVSTHERLRLYAAIAHRTPRSRKRRTD